jgi:hypothetical protein
MSFISDPSRAKGSSGGSRSPARGGAVAARTVDAKKSRRKREVFRICWGAAVQGLSRLP